MTIHFFLTLVVATLGLYGTPCSPSPMKTYIVYMDSTSKPTQFEAHEHWYSSVLHEATDGGGSRMLYTYSHASHGFAARLSGEEAAKLAEAPGCLGAFEETVYHLHTTYTPKFMGLDPRQGVWHDSRFADGIIIGVLDSGVWPESASFDDDGLGPVPPKWHGECESAPDFSASSCNKKLIGARFFNTGYKHAVSDHGSLKTRSVVAGSEVASPRDTNGHGTHTASTAGGSLVSGASLLGYAKGDAQGLASRARVAVYKVCSSMGCFGADILKAMDVAIQDGVDVLSLSLGSSSSQPFYMDPIAKGAFMAVSKGVFVSCSAGNDGPDPSTVGNSAPWIATVGASTIDREFPAMAVLGDGTVLHGTSLYRPQLRVNRKKKSGTMLPLVVGGASDEARFCARGSLDRRNVRGKIVVCERGMTSRVEKGTAVKEAGGVGMILLNQPSNGEELIADAHVLPALLVGAKAAATIKSYLRTAANPMGSVNVSGMTLIGEWPQNEPAPSVAAFSSRGPNPETPHILKPDVIAPGVNVLASWSRAVGFSGNGDTRRGDFNIISGTSMSCPHVSGLAALIRAIHPDWSISAVKSALMTTAFQQTEIINNGFQPIKDTLDESVATPFALGAGHIAPNKAVDPGLVYDAGISDYAGFLCSIGYTARQVSLVMGNSSFDCSIMEDAFSSPNDLNYPSISVVFAGNAMKIDMRRTVTNVGKGDGPWKYKIAIESPPHATITVSPDQLQFSRVNEKATFRVTIAATGSLNLSPRQEFGSITWSTVDGTDPSYYVVRSTVVVTWK